MLEIFNYWQVNLVLALLLFVIMHQCYRVIAQQVKDTASIAVITGIIGTVTFLLMLPFINIQLSHNWKIYGALLLSSIIFAVQDILKFKSYKYLDVSVITVLFQTSKVFFIFYGLVLFHEKLSTVEMIGIFLILLGATLVNFKKNKFKINKHAWLVFGAALAFSTAMIIGVDLEEGFNLIIYLLAIYFTPALIIFILKKKTVQELKNDFFITKQSPWFFLVAGLASALGMLFYLLALRQGKVSVVAPLSSVTVLLNVLAGYIFLEEKDDLGKRLIAAVLVIAGVFLLV